MTERADSVVQEKSKAKLASVEDRYASATYVFQGKLNVLLENCKKRGVCMKPYYTYRLPLYQAELWVSSRTIAEVNDKIMKLRIFRDINNVSGNCSKRKQELDAFTSKRNVNIIKIEPIQSKIEVCINPNSYYVRPVMRNYDCIDVYVTYEEITYNTCNEWSQNDNGFIIIKTMVSAL